MFIVQASMMEEFRQFLQFKYITEEDMIARVQGAPPKAWKAFASRAFLRLLGPTVVLPVTPLVAIGKWKFNVEDVEEARAQMEPVALHAIPCRAHVKTEPYGWVGISMQLDGMIGTTVMDRKVKFGSLDVAFYDSSLQWRAYLFGSKADEFTYQFFRFSANPLKKTGVLNLLSIEEASFYPYLGLGEDLTHWAERFLYWCRERDVLKHLREA